MDKVNCSFREETYGYCKLVPGERCGHFPDCKMKYGNKQRFDSME